MLGSSKNPFVAVTSSKRPYVFDVPHLLSLPEGFEFRFRYRHSWVQPGLPLGNQAVFSGREVIILFHSLESRHIIPIRRGTIIDLEKLGPMILLRFRVGPFARVAIDLPKYKYPSAQGAAPTPDAIEATQKLSARATALLGPIDGKSAYDFSQPLPDGWYFREGLQPPNEDDWDEGDFTVAWARAVAVLHREVSLSGIPFFLLLGFRNEMGVGVKPSAIENRFSQGREPIHGFSLQELERYRMRVLEWCERPETAPRPRVRLNCDFQKAHLALEGASNLVVGPYDVVEFTFLAQGTGYSEVGVRADNLDQEDKNDETKNCQPAISTTTELTPWADWPTILAARVPVVIRPKPRRFIFSAFAILIGLGLYILVSPRIDPEHPQWQNTLEVVALAILHFGYKTFADHISRSGKLIRGPHALQGD